MMAVSEATQVHTWKDKAPVVNTLSPSEVQDAWESSRANPR